MEWFFSAVLITVSAGITAFTGFLLRRLFLAEPAPGDALPGREPGGE